MAKIADKLDNINGTLNNINNTLEKMLQAINKPENPLFKVLEIAGLFAGIFGILSTVDIVLKWF